VTRFGAPLWFVAATKLAIGLALMSAGFFAVSDDDFSRLVIAQGFAKAPSLDPSGTSWLPLPFVAYGTAFALFGNSLLVARITGLLFGLLGALGVYCAARLLSLSPWVALIAGVLGAVFPHAAYYGAATVPDYPTAVLTLLGAISVTSSKSRVRLFGALSVCAATLCRYETWPVAVVVSLYALLDTRPSSHRAIGVTASRVAPEAAHSEILAPNPSHRSTLLATALVAPLGIVAWLMHGVVRHHDAFFFVKRVTAYKRALGGIESTWFERLYAQPFSLFRGEPELFIVTVTLLVVLALHVGKPAFIGESWKRPTVALGSLLVFLVIGELRDGAPTHHGERVLLSLWCGLTLLVAELLSRLLRSLERRFTQALTVFLLGLLVAVTARFVRPEVTPVEPFVDRTRELAMGRRLTAALPPHESVAVYTEDYGYFAIEAALGRPGALKPLQRRDPRHPEPDPMGHRDLLATRLSNLGTRYFVVPATQQTQARSLAQARTEESGFVLYERN
jgi:hypothetical protein